MNIAKKIKVFLSVKEQMSCLRDPKYIRYDDDIYSDAVYNLSFIKEYQKYSSDTKRITLFEMINCFEFSIFNFISALIILLTSSHFIHWFSEPLYILILLVLIINGVIGLPIGKINVFQRKVNVIKSDGILMFEKYVLNKAVEENKESKTPLPSIARKRL